MYRRESRCWEILGRRIFAVVLYLPGHDAPRRRPQTRSKRAEAQYSVTRSRVQQKSANSLEGTRSVLFGANPNGMPLAFLWGWPGDDCLSRRFGNLSAAKKLNLGFRSEDQLEVKVYVKGAELRLSGRPEADLALLRFVDRKKQRPRLSSKLP